MKIWDIVKEDFDGKQPLEEGWKNNVLATILAVSGMFNAAKAGETHPTGKVDIHQQQAGDSMRLDISKLFKSGQYQFHPDDEKIVQAELMRFGKEIQKNPVNNYVVQIVSSESQVPNFDAEPTSPTYKQRLQQMDLANRRAATVDFIIKQFTEDLKKRGVLKGNVTFVQPQILLGKTPWDPRLGKDNQAYTKDQFVIVNVKIERAPQTAAAADPYAAFADMGEKVHYGNKAVGMIFYPSRKTVDISQAGNTDTKSENVLFKVLKPESELGGGFRGGKNENVYTKSYIIPAAWWNQNVSSNTLTPEAIKYIQANFGAK